MGGSIINDTFFGILSPLLLWDDAPSSTISITGKGNRPGSASRLPPLLNDGSMKNDWPHEIFGVHY
jgi:hypothetical protein